VTAADDRPDEPFLAQDRERAFRGALGYVVLLGDRTSRRDTAGKLAVVDLAAHDVGYLVVERLRRFMINGHVIMLGTHGLTCVFWCPHRNL
jgi:hypothetical protein